jgi:viroplasmin and RNaseH domain-containing protein
MILYTPTSFKRKRKKVSNPTPKSYRKQMNGNSTFSSFMTVTTTYRRKDENIPSLSTTSGSCVKQKTKTYTGSKMVGIGTLHKSNAIPIFSDDDAKDLSSMRR